MEFEIVVSANDVDQGADNACEAEKCVIRAHRVIVASQCDWFRKALLSGMRESIDR